MNWYTAHPLRIVELFAARLGLDRDSFFDPARRELYVVRGALWWMMSRWMTDADMARLFRLFSTDEIRAGREKWRTLFMSGQREFKLFHQVMAEIATFIERSPL